MPSKAPRSPSKARSPSTPTQGSGPPSDLPSYDRSERFRTLLRDLEVAVGDMEGTWPRSRRGWEAALGIKALSVTTVPDEDRLLIRVRLLGLMAIAAGWVLEVEGEEEE